MIVSIGEIKMIKKLILKIKSWWTKDKSCTCTAVNKREQCYVLISLMPTEGIDETLTSLIEILEYHRESAQYSLPEPEIVPRGIGEVVSIVERPPLVISDESIEHSCGSDCHCNEDESKEDLLVAQKSHQEYLSGIGCPLIANPGLKSLVRRAD